MSELLRELEANATGKQGDDEGVERDALVLGSLPKDRVKLDGDADSEVAAGIDHLRDGTASGTMPATKKRGGAATNSPPPATGGWS